jgi:cytoskeletal protein CcmA (bactofilin family)
MWFKHSESKPPQQPESAAPRQQTVTPTPPAGLPPVETASAPSLSPPAAPAPLSTSSRITPGLVLKGEITGREDISIEGEMEGSLRLSGARVVVGATGCLRGNVEAREIVVVGRVTGNLRAEERLEITRTANVSGEAAAQRIRVEDGAVFNGSMEVIRAGEPRATSSAVKAQDSASAAKAREAAGGTRAEPASGAQASASAAGASAAQSSAGETWKGVPAIAGKEHQG